jgi:hypothetical protein
MSINDPRWARYLDCDQRGAAVESAAEVPAQEPLSKLDEISVFGPEHDGRMRSAERGKSLALKVSASLTALACGGAAVVGLGQFGNRAPEQNNQPAVVNTLEQCTPDHGAIVQEEFDHRYSDAQARKFELSEQGSGPELCRIQQTGMVALAHHAPQVGTVEIH